MIVVLQTLVFFRESLIAALERIFWPYLKHFSLTFTKNNNVSDDEDSEDHVFAEFDDEKGVVFCPPVYAQRYAAVSDCLMDERWCGKLEKVVDLGYHDMSFIKYLKDVPSIKHILGVDIESIPLRCSSDLLGCDEYVPKRESPLHVSLFQGNAADPDYRLIGCDAVIAIEMIEHMYPHDLERLVHTIFGFIKPWIAIITTPNGDFNPLFKSMEKNGFRRLDHFFEWSREQFHDWCSNIVVRYPQYTVFCRGVGPGPPGTIHYGCCSQLALFVSKDYHKQQDLDLNSLALVAKRPPNDVCDDVQAVEIPDCENDGTYSPDNNESYTELMFSNKQSCVTIVLSPAFSFETIEYSDKMSQCNLDTEIGKNFLMVNEEDVCGVVVPRRPKHNNRVYVIEDVNSRLNCTTLQVKKFSKKTQHLMAKNRMDSLLHTREVVDEIRHLAKMLNFNNESRAEDGDSIWRNINWGENAPYWNQYYQVVREYTYPFEKKSEECRILDLISDEISRFVDLQCDDDFSTDMSKVEIPLDHLMRVVNHVTDDVDKVRDILEWNGYEVCDGVVVYSRLALDTASVNSHDDAWPDSDTSDWDTDIHSTSLSNGSTIGADCNGRNLYRALDQKVRKLRSMMSHNEDISVELDRVVCRLTKLALRTARQRQRSLSNRWMQCKLFDLLNLTEKAIEKKRQMSIDINPLKAICYEDNQLKPQIDLTKIEGDEKANEIVNKYQHLIRSLEKTNEPEESRGRFYDEIDDELANEFLKESPSLVLNFEDIVRSPSLVDIEPIDSVYPNIPWFNSKETPLLRTKAWIDKDVNVVVYSQSSGQCISSGDTDHSACNIARYKNQKNGKKRKKAPEDKPDREDKHRKHTRSKTSRGRSDKKQKNDHPSCKEITSCTKLKKKSSYNIIIKTSSKKLSAVNIGNYLLKAKKSLKRHPTCSRPISETLMELCYPVTGNDQYNFSPKESTTNFIASPNDDCSISATKESLHIGIVMENKEEIIALRRTVGTDADDECAMFEFEQNNVHGSMTNVMNLDSFGTKTDFEFKKDHSHSLFLYDINEPSTSKGVRHVSMDAQCGPETNQKYAMLSTTTSLSKMPNIFNIGLKIENSVADVREYITNCDFGTCTNDDIDTYKTISPRERFTGIKIKDSVTIITEKVESATMTQEADKAHEMPSVQNNSVVSSTETTMLKPISSRLRIEDSGSEFCDSLSSPHRSTPYFVNYAKDASGFQIKLTDSKDVEARKFSHKYTRPKLSTGGVYVHSYKERNISEDVVYQGEWQKHISVPTQKKRSCNVVSKKSSEVNKKSKPNFKDNVSASKIVKTVKYKPPIPRNSNLKETKKAKFSDQVKKSSTTGSLPKVTNCKRDVTKVTPKFTIRPVLVKKSSHILRKPPKTTTIVKKDCEVVSKTRKKSYIPLYLKRKLAANNYHMLQSENAIEKTSNKEVELSFDKKITKNYINLDPAPRENISLIVFRNEIQSNPPPDINSSNNDDGVVNTENPNENNTSDDYNKRSPSQQSLSSAGSSPNSIATVRVRPKQFNRRHSSSSNKSTPGFSQVEKTPLTTKIIHRKCKSAKRYHDKVSEDKENLPETSKKNNQNVNSSYSKNNNVFRAQISTDNPQSKSSNTVNKRKSTKSNIKIPSIPSVTGKQSISEASSRPSVKKQRSNKSRSSMSSENKSTKDSITSDPVATSTTSDASDKGRNNVIINIVDNNLLTEWLNSTQSNIVENNADSIFNEMRELVEERLDFIDRMSNNTIEVDSRSVPNTEKCDSITISDTTSFYDAASLNSSYGTVMGFNDFDYSQIMDFDNTFFDSVVYNEFDPILDNDSIISIADTKPMTDLESLSFKSIAAASKMSEYFLAESSLNNIHEPPNLSMPTHSSVRDIFERKPQLTIHSPAGPLAVQAFSGLSMNAAPVTGDQPDHVNLVDSETGSVARGYTRQTTSEEVFISGRSSDSYESCVIDEDSVVPNWLFQIISQQQSVQEEDEDEDEEEESDTTNQTLAEPVYDMNGNTLEPGMGASAGAGDGRGIHSDHSQDSSGRGTSLSSSASSSNPQSEAILIEPSGFRTQFDLTHEPAGSSSVLVHSLPMRREAADTSHATVEGPRNARNTVNSSGDPQIGPTQATSDVDADISSTDTDVPDSSDN